jgi:hypothetical protein
MMDDWGERARPACRFGRRARNIVGQISWLKGFRRDAENGDRDGRAPQTKSPFRIPQGQRVAWLGARSLAMTEIRCRRTGTLFLNSFWDGRLGQLAVGGRGARVSSPAAASPDLTAWDFWMRTGLFTRCGWDSRAPNSAGVTGRVARRTKLGDDGNQMKADGNSFPVFILGWTIGANGV